MKAFRLFPVTQAALQDAHEQHERLMEQYVREPLRASAWRFECEMIDRYNAAGVVPRIEKPTFEQWKQLGESSNSGREMAPVQRTDELQREP